MSFLSSSAGELWRAGMEGVNGLLEFNKFINGHLGPFGNPILHGILEYGQKGIAPFLDDSTTDEDIMREVTHVRDEGFLSGLFGQDNEWWKQFLSDTFDTGSSGKDVEVSGSGSGLQPETINYLNAELARFYGMDRNTAYQEALSNTSYQRAVRDMQAAGLNPAAIFGNGRGSTASGVAYVGSGASSTSAAGVSSSDKLFERDTYGMVAALSGLATAVVTKRPQNFWLGQQAAQGIMQTLNVLDRKQNEKK